MRVFIENSSKDINTLKGKSLFCKKLSDVLKRRGVDVIDNFRAEVDISLNLIRLKHFNSRIKILRLDGVCHDTGKNVEGKNVILRKSLQAADAIVYQSKFAKHMSDSFLGVSEKPNRIIFNGSYPISRTSTANTSEKRIIMAFSKWRPHKRLEDAILSFLLANISNSLLVVAGDATKSGIDLLRLRQYFLLPNIHYIGNVNPSILEFYLARASASIHLCWFDACPNSVVEAIAAGVPVVCNNTGGTRELVAPSGGYVCDVDAPNTPQPVNLHHPPSIAIEKIADALKKCIKKKPKIKNSHILIENIADQYLRFMKELMK